MKHICNYMLSLGHRISIALLIAAFTLGAIYCSIMWKRAKNYKTCFHAIRIASSPYQGGLDVLVEEDLCGAGFITENIGTISLRGRGFWGITETPVFIYHISHNPGSEGIAAREPVVVWLSSDELQISVDRISHIISKLDEARGIKIAYKIGKVDYP